ncbi:MULTISPECIES: flagellar filament capping protein FliD [unclassified Shewanella]|jgi:flagellar hook-associated protein 2|uniref:flagellar filament capping protein FliD n=1 Tax=unclassified Shewanella TaxID=196818 RepID=UPI001A990F43|nr:flagellar filament capping protein FliD [Shewanella sp. 4t3-1-2LB]MBO1272153.1 flagellar filament capping protein FliD [Shewanella sp. 4t3-1-2LB]
MATSTSSATSLDPAYLAQQYTAIDRAAKDTLLQNQYNSYNTSLKAFQSLQSSLTDFVSHLKDFSADGLLASSAKVSSSNTMNVTVDGSAAPGSYQIYVQQLAQAHQLAMSFDPTQALPTDGDLGITVGSNEFVVDLSTLPATATLSDVATAINNSADNSGVNATVMQSGSETFLLLTSDETGAANQISLNFNAGTDPNGAAFASAVAGAQQLTAAQDAIVQLGSSSAITITSATNTLDNVIDGVKIDLLQAQASGDTPVKIDVAKDSDKTQENLQDIVDEYNNLMSKLTDDGIKNDSMSRNLQSLMRSSFQGLFDSKTLYSIGLEFDRTGKLTINSDRLDTALNTDPQQVANMLTGDNGLVNKLQTSLAPYSDRYGFLKTKVDNLQSSLDAVSKKQDDFDTKMQLVYKRYLNQFTQMQITISQLESSMSSFSS